MKREAVNVVLLISEMSFEERMQGTLEARHALLPAAVGDDQETVEMERSTMARRIATLLGGEFAARLPGSPSAPTRRLAIPWRSRARAGDALEQVILLPDGRVVGVIRGDVPPSGGDGSALLPARAIEAMGALGSASPFAGAEVLYKAPDAGEGPLEGARRDLVTLAERKRAAGHGLLAAGQPSEALGLYRDAMAFARRRLDPRGDPGAEPAALWAAIHRHLVPAGLLAEAGASALARAGEVARAFASVAVAPPEALVTAVAADACGLVAKARGSLGEQAGTPRLAPRRGLFARFTSKLSASKPPPIHESVSSWSGWPRQPLSRDIWAGGKACGPVTPSHPLTGSPDLQCTAG